VNLVQLISAKDGRCYANKYVELQLMEIYQKKYLVPRDSYVAQLGLAADGLGQLSREEEEVENRVLSPSVSVVKKAIFYLLKYGQLVGS